MSLRSSSRAAPAAKTRSTTETASAPADRQRAADCLDVWLARDWSDAVHLGTLEDFQQIHVCTVNTLYELVVVSPRGDVRVRGGKYFPDWTAARLAGCTAGGSFLRRHTIALGLRMEIEVDCRRIVTSPVRTIVVLEECVPAEPN
jgi:hypothetical protein